MRRRALLAASQMMGGESDNGLSDYFHVISHEDQEISFSFESQYNFNDGSGWHDLEIWEPVSIPKDSILYVANTDIGDTFPEPRVLDDAQNISLAGNIMSLVYGHNFREQYSLKGYDYIFYGFAGSELYGPAVKSIENLILPAIELSEYCYSYMFNGNVNIKKAPELPATILAEGCYMGMFSSCESLNYIKMLATDISDRDCLNSWVERVSPTGTFVKHPEATWDVRGDSGVPEGWTIKFDGEEEGGGKIITFTMTDYFGMHPTTEYEAEEGMTWIDFCESKYNIDNWKVVYHEAAEDYLILSQYDEYVSYEGSYVRGNEIIIPNGTYDWW